MSCGLSLWSFPRYEKRIALIICNAYELSSVSKDIDLMRGNLHRLGYRREDVHVIASGLERSDVTNVRSANEFSTAVASVMRRVTTGTSLLISISSHGEHDRSRTETVIDHNGRHISDGTEFIRFSWGGRHHIYTDVMLRSMLVEPVPRGAEVLCLVDTCHSATMIDLPSSVRVDMSSRKALVSRNLSAQSLKCDCICIAPTVDTAVTYEDLRGRGGMLTNMFCDYIKECDCIDMSKFIIEMQTKLSSIKQSAVLSCSTALQHGVYDI